MWIYVLVFLVCFVFDLIPVFGPPAWTAMVFFQIKYDLNIWIVLVVGVIASTLGRYLMSLYIPYLSNRIINVQKNEDLKFLGKKIEENRRKGILFVFLYTLIPVPSAPIFTAAGIARVNPLILVPPFLAGKFISDAVMVITGKYVADNASTLMHGMLTWKTCLSFLLSLVILGALLFIDWRTLFQKKKLRFEFRIWKSKSSEKLS
jgi:membrane protein YqaA with SNARE-associated domain